MSYRTIYLLAFRRLSSQRAHFSIWVPYQEGGETGTAIHVIGTPMSGYSLEFKRAYKPEYTEEPKEMFAIGQINAENVHDWPGTRQDDSTPIGNLEVVAAQIPPPRKSQNFLAPVNDTTNRRCQEWTTDFIRRLVETQYLDSSVLDQVQARRDPPTHGV
ncbi:uncharacterized protein BDZ99DRAFT_344495, partial [Mytilinidion resinicola]